MPWAILHQARRASTGNRLRVGTSGCSAHTSPIGGRRSGSTEKTVGCSASSSAPRRRAATRGAFGSPFLALGGSPPTWLSSKFSTRPFPTARRGIGLTRRSQAFPWPLLGAKRCHHVLPGRPTPLIHDPSSDPSPMRWSRRAALKIFLNWRKTFQWPPL